MSSSDLQRVLFDALKTRDVEGVRRALNAGADPNGADERGRAPLFFLLLEWPDELRDLHPHDKMMEANPRLCEIQAVLFQAGARGDVTWQDGPDSPLYDGLITQIQDHLEMVAWGDPHPLVEQVHTWLDHGARAMLPGDTCNQPTHDKAEPVHHVFDDLEWILYNWANEPDAPTVNKYVAEYLGQLVAALAKHGLDVHPQHEAHWEHLSDAFSPPHSLRSWIEQGQAQRRARDRESQGLAQEPSQRPPARRRP